MKEFDKPFKLDKNNLWHIDSKDVILNKRTFSEAGKKSYNRSSFYLIDGIPDYIIKDDSKYTKLFRKQKILKMVKELTAIQDNLPNIGFPVGYFSNCGKVEGTIVPYYKDSISIHDFSCYSKFEELSKYYNRSSNNVDNFISMLLDVLDIISSMYDNNISYTDIHPGNFILYDNQVKVVDFEPNYLYYKQKGGYCFERMLKNYALAVYEICRRLGFDVVGFDSGESFMDAEEHVKVLGKRLER